MSHWLFWQIHIWLNSWPPNVPPFSGFVQMAVVLFYSCRTYVRREYWRGGGCFSILLLSARSVCMATHTAPLFQPLRQLFDAEQVALLYRRFNVICIIENSCLLLLEKRSMRASGTNKNIKTTDCSNPPPKKKISWNYVKLFNRRVRFVTMTDTTVMCQNKVLWLCSSELHFIIVKSIWMFVI